MPARKRDSRGSGDAAEYRPGERLDGSGRGSVLFAGGTKEVPVAAEDGGELRRFVTGDGEAGALAGAVGSKAAEYGDRADAGGGGQRVEALLAFIPESRRVSGHASNNATVRWTCPCPLRCSGSFSGDVASILLRRGTILPEPPDRTTPVKQTASGRELMADPWNLP